VPGSGFAWNGNSATVSNSAFAFNGDPYAVNTTSAWPHNMVSDGLTMGQTEGSLVQSNVFQDNSDVNVILGGGPGTTVRGNTVFMRQSSAGAGLMLDNFGGGTPVRAAGGGGGKEGWRIVDAFPSPPPHPPPAPQRMGNGGEGKCAVAV
jgi:hypothetical protein